MRPALLASLVAARESRRAAATLTRLADGAQALWLDGVLQHGELTLSPALAGEVATRLAADRSGTLDGDAGLFLRVYLPPPRLAIVGAVHIAQTLAPLARLVGHDITIIDPRRAFASAARFPDVTLDDAWPDEALAARPPDAMTAVVTLTHDPKLDDPALAAALASPAYYIGALGSRRTHAARCARLREQGFDEAAIARIHAPVGLDLGGRLPAEIAVSILAQMQQVRYRGTP